jgi:hypothetical protein
MSSALTLKHHTENIMTARRVQRVYEVVSIIYGTGAATA